MKWSIYLQYMKSISIIPLTIIIIAFISWQVFAVSANIWLSIWGNDKPLNGTQADEQRNYRLGIYGALGFGEGKFSCFKNMMKTF